MAERPTTSPWGKVQRCRTKLPGVFEVRTEGHGGIMVKMDVAEDLLSPAAKKCGFQERGYLCFEEDCNASVVIRELLNKNLWKLPEYFTEGREKYEQIINNSLMQWNPEYWRTHGKPHDIQLLEQHFTDRIETNYTAYHALLMKIDKKTIIEMAGKIAAVDDVHNYIKSGEHSFEKSEMEYLLQYKNPLDILADHWHDRTSDTSDMEFAINYVLDKRDLGNDYPLMDDTNRGALEKSKKPSILAQVKEHEKAVKPPDTKKNDGLEH